MATTYLSKNLPANQNSLHKWTYSGWVKRCDLGAEIYMFNFYDDANNRGGFRFNTDDTLLYYDRVGGSTVCNKVTNRKFRDTSAWYHVMVAVDKSVSSPDTKIYVNGVEETSFSTDTDYTQNQSTKINDNDNLYINSYDGSSDIKSQIQSHVHWVSGYALTPATFGSTDATTGEWKINTSPSVTYGTNGFFILKDGNSVTDQSGNSNNFTVGAGTLTNTEDCPSNVFATMNSLLPSADALVDHANGMSNGNLHNGDQSPNNWNAIGATMGASTGKFYWEFKIEGVWGNTSQTSHRHGIANLNTKLNNNRSSAGDVAWTDDTYAIGYQNSNGVRYNNSVTMTSEFGTYVANDILMFAMDLTNLKLYFGKNGTWLNSGDPTSGSTGTGAYSIPVAGIWCPYSETKYGSDKVSWNIGNGVFKVTAISSEGTNASGIGKFEYDVPSGYTALSTKGLNL